MPVAIPDGGTAGEVTSSQLTAYAGATLEQTPEGDAVLADVEARVQAIAQGWEDSGGTGGRQTQVASEVLERAAALQGELARTVRQWAKPGRERALMEMFGTLTKALVERDRLLLELRERLNQSPY